MKKYTIEEIKNWLMTEDSFDDALYFLSEERIDKANAPKEPDDEDCCSNCNGECECFDHE